MVVTNLTRTDIMVCIGVSRDGDDYYEVYIRNSVESLFDNPRLETISETISHLTDIYLVLGDIQYLTKELVY